MHILILTDRFAPEVTAVSVRTLAHAKVWLQMGHEVTVVTSVPNFPRGVVFSGYRNKILQEEFIDGIRVIRLWTYMTANAGTIKRTFDYLSFSVSSILQCWRLPRFDILVGTSPPIFVPIAARVISFLRRRPWVFEVRDLWPASIRAVGASSSSALVLVEKLELSLYHHASHVVVLTHSFKKDLIARGVDGEKVSVVTNGIEVRAFQRAGDNGNAREEIGVDADSFLLGYVGTTGMAHGLETVLEAAAYCRNSTRIKFLIMGEGAERKTLEEKAQELQLENVIFKDFVPHNQVTQYLSALDMTIVHLKPDPVFLNVIPSKIFESMALGIPILHAVEGESAKIVADAGCGVCVPSGQPRAIADVALKYMDKRPELEEMSLAGKNAVQKHYDRAKLAKSMSDTLMNVVMARARSNPVNDD